MSFWKWFLSSFNHDYRDTPDYKKIMAFQIANVLCLICIFVVYKREDTSGLVIGSLCMVLGGLVGFQISPMFSKTGSALKSQELQQMSTPTTAPAPVPELTPDQKKEDLKKRAIVCGLPETATEEEILKAELKIKEENI